MKLQTQTTKSNSILSIVKYGDPILRKRVEDITDFTSLPDMTEQMFNAMYEGNGIGLAANQVGWSLNLLILDTSSLDGEEDSEFNQGDTFIDKVELDNNKLALKCGLQYKMPEQKITIGLNLDYTKAVDNLKTKQEDPVFKAKLAIKYGF